MSCTAVTAHRAQLGEGPFWDVPTQALYWVDILGRQLHRWRPGDGKRAQWTFDEEISAVAERRDAPGLLVTLRRGFAWFDPATGAAPRYVYQPEGEPPGNRFNDGDYLALAATVSQKVAHAVEHCKLDARADAMLHLVIADLLAGAEAMEGKAGKPRHDGAVQVMQALKSYGKYFRHPGWKVAQG